MAKYYKENFYDEYAINTGTLKKSYSNDPLVNLLRFHLYMNAHQYNNMEFPKPLEGKRHGSIY